MEVDLNCDLGEGAGGDAAIIPLITSANISCGFHAGGSTEALSTIRLAKQAGIVIGAHPGHPEREHFGRRELTVSPDEVYAECVYQVGALAGLAKAEGATLRYLKPHGGLYHQANRDAAIADAIASAANLFELIVMGLPGSELEKRCAGRFVAEGFADRRYRPDGTLVPRDQPDAFIHEPAEAVAQVRDLLARGVRTICVHGDNPQALAFVQALRAALTRQGVRISPFA